MQNYHSHSKMDLNDVDELKMKRKHGLRKFERISSVYHRANNILFQDSDRGQNPSEVVNIVFNLSDYALKTTAQLARIFDVTFCQILDTYLQDQYFILFADSWLRDGGSDIKEEKLDSNYELTRNSLEVIDIWSQYWEIPRERVLETLIYSIKRWIFGRSFKRNIIVKMFRHAIDFIPESDDHVSKILCALEITVLEKMKHDLSHFVEWVWNTHIGTESKNSL